MSRLLSRFVREFVTVQTFEGEYSGRLVGFDDSFIVVQQFNQDGSHRHYVAQPFNEMTRLKFGGEAQQEERLKVEFYRNTRKQIESVFNDHSD
jgi:hypothetical protein